VFGWHRPFYVKENVTKEKPDETFLDAETRGLIEEANRLDLELYEYARKLFDEHCRAAGDSFAEELCHFRRSNRASARPVPRFARLLRRIGLYRAKFTTH
jgi:hypothetical protein